MFCGNGLRLFPFCQRPHNVCCPHNQFGFIDLINEKKWVSHLNNPLFFGRSGFCRLIGRRIWWRLFVQNGLDIVCATFGATIDGNPPVGIAGNKFACPLCRKIKKKKTGSRANIFSVAFPYATAISGGLLIDGWFCGEKKGSGILIKIHTFASI